MKSKKTKIIIIAIAVAVVIAGIILAVVGFNAGWFSSQEEFTKKPVYDQSGEYVVRDEYYNKDGELQYKVIKGYSDEKKEKLSQESYLDANDKLTQVKYYGQNGMVTGIDEFNEEGKVSVHHDYENGEKTGTYYEYEYTESGLPLSSKEYDAQGNIVKTVTREYTADEKITLYHEVDGKGRTISKTVYEYNAKGLESKATFYDAEGLTGHVEYEYDDQNRQTKKSEYINNKLQNYRTYTYDKNGEVKEEFHQVGTDN